MDHLSFTADHGHRRHVLCGGQNLNVFDFDGTIYRGDSSKDFYLFCLIRRPYILLKLPRQLLGHYRYRKGAIDRTMLKQCYYSFFSMIDIEKMTERFWDVNSNRIEDWYLDIKKDDDVVISASPDFLVREGCRRIGVRNVVASQVDPSNGVCTGPNCRGKEKVVRFRREFGDAPVEDFYSDSEIDLPMAKISKKAYLVREGVLEEWLVER